MIYCLNPNCTNPSNPDGTKFCQKCGTGLVLLLRDRYRIISLLGSGGFGRTFLAEDTDTPSQRRCVIKQLKPIAHNPEIEQLVQERFQREAAVLEELGEEKEQIPRLYAYFTLAGQFYLVQQWIDGETLTQKVQQEGFVSETTVKNILISLLPVLDYVHLRGIIHRDIKPDNIIIRRRDGLPVLIDFGAVKEIMGTMVTNQSNPASSIVIGTPGYMPSEQAAGRPVRSSDLYSLGLTAIYALTGKQPQELPIDQDTSEILWHSNANNLSPEFVAVLDKAIRWHPRERYSRGNAMLNALQYGTAQVTSIQQSVPSTQPVEQQVISPPITSPPPITNKDQQQQNPRAKFPWGLLLMLTLIYTLINIYNLPFYITGTMAIALAGAVACSENVAGLVCWAGLIALGVATVMLSLGGQSIEPSAGAAATKALFNILFLFGVAALFTGWTAGALRQSFSIFPTFFLLSCTSLLGLGLGILLRIMSGQ